MTEGVVPEYTARITLPNHETYAMNFEATDSVHCRKQIYKFFEYMGSATDILRHIDAQLGQQLTGPVNRRVTLHVTALPPVNGGRGAPQNPDLELIRSVLQQLFTNTRVIATLGSISQALEEIRHNHATQLQRAETNRTHLAAEHQKEIDRLTVERSTLEAQLRALHESDIEQTTRLAKLKDEHEKAQILVNQLRTQISERDRALEDSEQLEQQNQALRAELAACRKLIPPAKQIPPDKPDTTI